MKREINISFRKLFIMLFDRRMTQAQLSEISGVSSASISRLKQDKLISVKALYAICDALGCELEDILEVHPVPKDEINERRSLVKDI